MTEQTKAKVKRYGKKNLKIGDLSADFASLNISCSPVHTISTINLAHAAPNTLPVSLRPRSGNRNRNRPRSRTPRSLKSPRRLGISETYADVKPPSNYYRSLLEATGATDFIRFDHWEESTKGTLTILKIGDGSYADVYKFAERKNPRQYVIGKLIPIRPEKQTWDDMTTIEDAMTEIRLLDSVTEIPGFVEYRGAHVLYGPLPATITRPTNKFNEARKKETATSQNRTGRSTFPDDQVWLLLEMSDAGQDLDTLLEKAPRDSPIPLSMDRVGNTRKPCLDVRQTRDLFWATATALAHGEDQAQFEHRDLHLSNICVKRNREVTKDESYAVVPAWTQLEVALIDYTLSRASVGDNVIYNAMTDPELFTGKGDLQFETYRHMRNAVKAKGKARWDQFEPRTNVLWLHHLLAKLLGKTHEPQKDDLPRSLWEAMVQLKDATNPKTIKAWDYRSANDLVKMGKGR